ncbi:signal peptidase I [Enterococcus moraviensis ATCC BAA-383]|uniref:Signal peptidase I n=1 Tax=Enterococcus moraviensis ATCC BAA-383 TaxID=1158609 RepID=R2T5X0_9ENTE|nr:signal peptidase I [Enterococcus moraviensis ATCC BAA-383]EOT73342.1 signal peptidase I [Enterococcus moraviensis ATCC BAA-383]OJG68899.1 signal peptidase I [Enterococcus moraviensis]
MEKQRSYIAHFIFFMKLLVPSLVLLFILRGFILIPVPVDGNSMEKTLSQGDMIVMEKFSSIKRFDVVVFKLPNGAIYIKRIIGLPGDNVRYENDQLFINDKPIEEPFLEKNIKKDHETAPYTTNFNLSDLTTEDVLPKDNYLVLGDNRRMSKDSRSFGAVESKYILGKAQFVYYPITHMKIIPR